MYQQVPEQTPQSYIKTITIIHIGLFAGQFMFAAIVLFITPQKGLDFNNTKDPLFFLAPLLAVAGIAGSIFLFKKVLESAKGKVTLKEKLMTYQAALIQRYALVNGPSMFATVVYMLTGNLFYIIIAGVLTLYLLVLRPTKDKIVNDLDLSYDDKMMFDSQDVLS